MVLLDQLRREARHLVPRVVVGGPVAVPPRQGPVAAAPRPAAVQPAVPRVLRGTRLGFVSMYDVCVCQLRGGGVLAILVVVVVVVMMMFTRRFPGTLLH